MIAAITKLTKRRKAGDIAAELRDGIEELRSQRARLFDQKQAIEGQPWPLDEVDDAIRRGLDEIAERARSSFYTAPLLRGERGPTLGSPSHEIIVGLLVAANRPAIEGVLHDLVAPAYEGFTPLSAADRAAEIARLNEGLSDLERAEESAVREAERAGLAIARRDDADGDVLLLSDRELGLDP